MTTATKIRPIEQHMIDTQGFYFAKVTMFSQDYMTGGVSDRVESYQGYIKQIDCGIIYMIRPEANMRSNNKTQILTVSQRLISVEKFGA